jgi:uncharacterized protein YydD (DUF2326 family)
MKQNTKEYLIDKIVDLKVNLYSLENKNENLTNELNASKAIITNLKLELTNIRLLTSIKNEQDA